MTTALRELLAIFTVDTGQAVSKLSALDSTIGKTANALGELAKTALAAFSVHAVSGFLEEMIQVGSQLNDTSEKLGIGTDELQKFQYAAKLSGVGADEAARALQFLNKNMGEAIGGNKESVKQFAELGIALKDGKGNVRELGDVIPEVADSFAKMGSDQERTAQAMKLFGKSGAALIPLFKNGSSELIRLNAQFEQLGLGISEDFIKKADDAGDSLDTLKLGFRALKTHIAVEVLPSITELTKKFSGFTAFAIKLTKETHIVKEAWVGMSLAAVAGFIKIGMGWTKMLGLVSGKGGIIKNLIGLGWLGLIIAAVGALYLVFDDLFTLFTGGESVTEELLDSLFGIGTSAEVIEYVKNLFGEVNQAVAALQPLFQLLGGWMTDAFKLVWPYLVAFEKFTLLNMVNAVKAAVLIVKWATDELGAALSAVGQMMAVAGKFSGKDGLVDAGNAFSKVGAGLMAVSAGPAIPDKSDQALGLRDLHQSNHVDITVVGGPTNADTGRAVAGALGSVYGDQNQQAKAALLGGAAEDD